MIKACFVHCRGCVSANSSAQIPELTTSWCSISWIVRTNAFDYHGGFPLWAAINWSHSSLQTPPVCCTINCRPFTMIWIHSHPTACCFSLLLLPVLGMIFECASWVISLVAALAASGWPTWCLLSCCVPIIAVLDVAPANRLDWDLLPPGWGGCVSMICWDGIGEQDDNEKIWEALSTI